ncbi:MarR family transcriptional regulator [Nocardia yunnanensis]|uniref:MarR family transcriptional regulator n=2 Tax=Nocardia yunnanensis TaxID=2382165 RepID=A0A386Z8Z4_9NOCA|nr:MarR family transcriptional regulator [Nocardia yunnanensis]
MGLASGPAFGKLRRGVLQEVENPISTRDSGRALVLSIVWQRDQQPDGEVSVGSVAAYMCIDPSVGSRMVTENIKSGYLIRVPSQLDGRRAVLQLTPKGQEFLREYRKQQRRAYEYITADWSEQDRLDFARLMLLRYVESIENLNRRPAADA